MKRYLDILRPLVPLVVFAIASRLLFHMDWMSRGELALQYSHFIYGVDVWVPLGNDPLSTRQVRPDNDVFSLMATYWW